MFGKKPGVRHTKLTTVIAPDVHLSGSIEFSDGLRLDGHVQGNVTGRPDSQSMLLLSDCGSIHGTVRAYHMVINGTIVGDVISDHFLELQANARITGDIYYQQLRLDYGATVEGKLMKQGAMNNAADAKDTRSGAPALTDKAAKETAPTSAVGIQVEETAAFYKLEQSNAMEKPEKLDKGSGNSKKSTQRNLNAPIGDQLMKAKGGEVGDALLAATHTADTAINPFKQPDSRLSLAGSLTKHE